jgi:CRP/FNR family transcriptional regulator, anaerobic regulatory protein
MNTIVHLRPDRPRTLPIPPAASAACDPRATVAELLNLMGAPTDALRTLPPLSVSWQRLHAGATLHHEGAVAHAICFVRAGAFKIFRTAEDGYEQVLGFALRGEVLGFEALAHGTHPSSAVALEESSVYSLPLDEFDSIGQRLPQLSRLVHRALSNALTRRSELAEVMAAVAAEVRLARFLLQLSRRMAECGQSPRRFHLRMSRRDIASYLGVAHETVSRSFGALSRWGWLSVDNREIEILDLPGLKQFALNTRRAVDDWPQAQGAHPELQLCAS